MGDPARVKQILTNLVGNAVKFTPGGEITLRAQLISLQGDEVVIQCSVKDTGIGIPQDRLDRLFAGLPESALREFSLALVTHVRRMERERSRSDAFRFVDPLAAAVAVEPGIVTRSLRASIDVALAPGIAPDFFVVTFTPYGAPPMRNVFQQRSERNRATSSNGPTSLSSRGHGTRPSGSGCSTARTART